MTTKQTFAEFWGEVANRHARVANIDNWRFGQRLFNDAPRSLQNALLGTLADPFYKADIAVGKSYSDLETIWNEVVL